MLRALVHILIKFFPGKKARVYALSVDFHISLMILPCPEQLRVPGKIVFHLSQFRCWDK